MVCKSFPIKDFDCPKKKSKKLEIKCIKKYFCINQGHEAYEQV